VRRHPSGIRKWPLLYLPKAPGTEVGIDQNKGLVNQHKVKRFNW